MYEASRRRIDPIAGGRLCRPGGEVTMKRVEAVTEGAYGGTTGSPTTGV